MGGDRGWAGADDLIEQEEEPGFGQWGLGRLAACFLDSLTTLDIPAVGYSIRYEFGILTKRLRWLSRNYRQHIRFGNPGKSGVQAAVEVKFGGHTEAYIDQSWYQVLTSYQVKGIPYDTPILGYNQYSQYPAPLDC